MRLLAVFLVATPAILMGIENRLLLFPANRNLALSADAIGFEGLADLGIRLSAGWREPLFPLIVSLVKALFGLSSLDALESVVIASSCCVLPLLFLLTYRLVGPLSAIISVYLAAFSAPLLQATWYRERADLYLCLLLVGWLLLSFGRTVGFIVVAAIATYVRITSWMSFGLSFAFALATVPELRKRSKVRGLLGPRWLTHVLLYLSLTFPLFFYYRFVFGSYLYPQQLALYDHFVRFNTGQWLVNVTGNFDVVHEIPLDFGWLRFFGSLNDFASKMLFSLQRIYLPQTSSTDVTNFLVFAHPLFVCFFAIGILAACFSQAGRLLLVFFLSWTIPFIPIGFLPDLNARFFTPSLVLGYAIIGAGFEWGARIFSNSKSRSIHKTQSANDSGTVAVTPGSDTGLLVPTSDHASSSRQS